MYNVLPRLNEGGLPAGGPSFVSKWTRVKLVNESHYLGKAEMFLINLSKRILKLVSYIGVASLFLHLVGVLLKDNDSVE